MKRVFDLSVSVLAIFLLCFPMLLILLVVRLTSPGPAIHWSKRVGVNQKIFVMPKFRTMKIDTPDVATHLLESPKSFYTPFGSFLRKTSLDELPQLWSIFKGDMSFVGPRPALFNQEDLVSLREAQGMSGLKPGLTGWAQVNGRDEISILEKVKLEEEYFDQLSFSMDIYILYLTIIKVFKGENVTH